MNKFNFSHFTLFNIKEESERQRVLKEYKKIIAVRHPLERVLSAYRNKFESKTSPSEFFHKEIGSKIIKAFRTNATEEEIKSGSDVTFLEYIKYITDSDFNLLWNNNQSFNEHWEPINGLCRPCDVNYDFIIQFDNLGEESNIVLRKIKPEVYFPLHDEITPEGTIEKLEKYFNEIPLKYLRTLEKIYKVDNLLFNYSGLGAFGVDLQ